MEELSGSQPLREVNAGPEVPGDAVDAGPVTGTPAAADVREDEAFTAVTGAVRSDPVGRGWGGYGWGGYV
ncbi:hypothetical protein [Streptomyces sp. NPDC047973]|uniref:hypothetical protein n=1 Tax=Streptomyces sp. NPDC047973 TaxID=3155383 RepID=UPI00341F14D2